MDFTALELRKVEVITLVYSRNYHNIEKQLYEKKERWK